MPITQATILAIYGDLCDLAEKLETLANQATQPELFPAEGTREGALIQGILSIDQAAKEAQRQAIEHMMRDDRKIRPNPLTGRLDE